MYTQAIYKFYTKIDLKLRCKANDVRLKTRPDKRKSTAPTLPTNNDAIGTRLTQRY